MRVPIFLTPEIGNPTEFESIMKDLILAASLDSFLNTAIRRLETYTDWKIGTFSEAEKARLQKKFLEFATRLNETQLRSVMSLSFLGLTAINLTISHNHYPNLHNGETLKVETKLVLVPGSKPLICIFDITKREDKIFITGFKISNKDILVDSEIIIDPTKKESSVNMLTRVISIPGIQTISDLLSLMHEQAHLNIEPVELIAKPNLALARINFFSRIVNTTISKEEFISGATKIAKTLNVDVAHLLVPIIPTEVKYILAVERQANVDALRLMFQIIPEAELSYEYRTELMKEMKEYLHNNYGSYQRLSKLSDFSTEVLDAYVGVQSNFSFRDSTDYF